jgi:hypothetical protein
MVRGRGFLQVDAASRHETLIAYCHQCRVKWDIGLQPSPCYDGSHDWTLRIT